MPKVMLRKDNESGVMTLYVAKKDLEETVVAMEHPGPGKWGGELTLADGSRYFVDPMDEMPNLPITVRAKRVGGDED
ncbi:MAG: putative nitrogen fixation protein NifT [Gammaproteobacteria bacterium]|nr:putative nitrogen fixation protein NifT [Gammaproteobacteria bacterium]